MDGNMDLRSLMHQTIGLTVDPRLETWIWSQWCHKNWADTSIEAPNPVQKPKSQVQRTKSHC